MKLTGRSRRESPCFKGVVAKDAKTRGLSANNKLFTKKEGRNSNNSNSGDEKKG